jgi:amino acid transporter
MPAYAPSVYCIATVADTLSIVVLSCLGFDGISRHSEESGDGQNSAGRATLLPLVLIGTLFFILQIWIATDLAKGVPLSSPETALWITERAGDVWRKTCSSPGG